MKKLFALSFLFAVVAEVEIGQTIILTSSKNKVQTQLMETEKNTAKVFSGLVKSTRELMRPVPQTDIDIATANTNL